MEKVRTGRVDCAIYDRDSIGPGDSLAGPAVVEALDTTIVVPPGWRVQANDSGHLIMEAQDHAE